MTNRQLRCILLAGTALSAGPLLAQELPTGPSVAHGSVGISTPSAGHMAIDQSSANAVVNWRGFSVGAGGRVDIRQPSSSSALLNRVTGSTPSSIAGQINANGRVFLVNPNGIVLTKSGAVNAGAFVASTLATTDEAFLAGRHEFSGNGRSAAVENHGAISVGPGGYAALIGGRVNNTGTITAPLGRIGLGAGEMVTLDLGGDGFLQVGIPSEEADDTLIRQSGRLSADGGRVEIKAATARQAARQAINLSGVVEARSVGGRSGAIVLGGGSGGRVHVSGTLRTRAPAPQTAVVTASPHPRPRPAIDVTGAEIVLAGATLDASGAGGGGVIRIGGDYQGGGDLPRARSTLVDGTTLITADALGTGGGGRVILWSDDRTDFRGTISARGGDEGGDGGFSEVSGRAQLAFSGRVDLGAPAGRSGTLLLDPYDVFIEDLPDGRDRNIDFDLESTPTRLSPTTIERSPGPSIIDPDTLVDQLRFADVIVQTGTDGPEVGNITVGAALSWGSGTTLTLDAANAIIIAAPISAAEGGLRLVAGAGISTPETWTRSDGTDGIGGDGAIRVGTFILSSGDWRQQSPLPALPDFEARDFRVVGGSFLRVTGGEGTPGDPYLITDVYGLQGIDSAPLLASNFALANDIDANGTAGWNDFAESVPAGFDPIGDADGEGGGLFSGNFDGRGNTIDGLTIDRGSDHAGVFSQVGNGAVIQNVGLTDVDILGAAHAGGLVGHNFGTVTHAFVTGSVQGSDGVGGLVGYNDVGGRVVSTYSDATVAGGNFTGGLVGVNSGNISTSYARGTVIGVAEVGGLVGRNYSQFDAANGTIDQTYAAGEVSASGASGGLVGVSRVGATVADSFWDTEATGQATSEGGTPLTTDDFQDAEDFMALAEPAGWNFATTWAPPSLGFYPALYSLEPVARVDANDATTQYGTAPDLTGALFGGPDAFVFGPPGDSLDAPTLATEGVNVGTHAIGVDGDTTRLTSDLGVDYRLVVTEGTLTITPAPLTITADDLSKAYGTAVTFAGTEFTVDGLVDGDSVTSVDLASDGAAASAPISGGPYAITASNAVGEGLSVDGVSNYTITYVDGVLTIDAAPLVITADSFSKTYGDLFTFAGTEFSVEGLRDGDSVTAVDLASDGAAAGATVFGGPYAVTASNAQGSGLFDGGVSNYDITYVDGTLTIDPRPLTITADSASKVYGETYPLASTAFSITQGSLAAGDSIDAIRIVSDGATATAPVFGSPYDIVGSDAVGTGLAAGGVSNYDISFEDGRLTVTPRPLTITANSTSKLFGTEVVFSGREFTVGDGLVNGDRVDLVDLASDGAPASASLEGSPYAIRASDPQGTGLAVSGVSNYDFTYVDGTLGMQAPTPVASAAHLAALLPGLPNPPDSPLVLAAFEGGPISESPASRAGDIAIAESTLSFLEAIAQNLEEVVEACRRSDPAVEAYLACLGTALDDYAEQVDRIALDLPQPLQGVSAIIQQASREIGAARDKATRRLATAETDAERAEIGREAAAEARAAIGTATVEIRKAIALIRADEPQLASLQVQQGDAITAALDSVGANLERAVGL